MSRIFQTTIFLIQEDVIHLFDLGRVSGNFTNYVSVSVTPTQRHVLTCISATITSHHSRSKTVLKLSLPGSTLSVTSFCHHHHHHHLILPGATLSPTHLRKLNSSKPWLALRLLVIHTDFYTNWFNIKIDCNQKYYCRFKSLFWRIFQSPFIESFSAI